jgi:UDP-N-acetylmuramate--alanine ligase
VSIVKTIAQESNVVNSQRRLLGKDGLKNNPIHFIGIGGIGMSSIAAILSGQGYIITGSDIKESPVTQRLAAKGIKVFSGHNADYLCDAKIVVYSSAIKQDNTELRAAKERGLILMHRSQALAELMQDKTCIAIGGAHGKTTTTALTGHLLRYAGFHPTLAAGGIAHNLGDNSCLGNSEYFVAEADESDGTLLYYYPAYSIVTNIDREHLDYYKSWQDMLEAYKEFISHTKENGGLFCCGDDKSIRQITRGYQKKITYFGLSEDNDFYPKNIILNEFSSEFSYYYKGKAIGKARLPLSGKHNISNSLAVIALGCELGIGRKNIEEALSSFKGTERRFQLKLDSGGIRIIDDYGHHPSEIMATLQAAKNVAHSRLIVVFQPHRYSRTMHLMEEFTESFGAADYLMLTDIYAASEKPVEGVSSQVLYERIKEKFPAKEVCYIQKDRIVEHLLSVVRQKDLILTLGAGDIGSISNELVKRIKSEDTF